MVRRSSRPYTLIIAALGAVVVGSPAAAGFPALSRTIHSSCQLSCGRLARDGEGADAFTPAAETAAIRETR